MTREQDEKPAGVGEAHVASSAAANAGPLQFEVVQFAPPQALVPYVTQCYHFRCDAARICDAQPASLGHLIFYLRGGGKLRFADGQTYSNWPVSLFGPGMAHAEFDLSGPFEHIGFALSPLGFVALTGRSALSLADKMIDAAEVFGPDIAELAARFRAARQDGSISIREIVEQATDFLASHARPVAASHAGLVRTVAQWLSSDLDPDVDMLFASLDKSRSTATRLIRHYFGASPKQLMRKYRALRAAIVLVDPDATREMRARVESLFYDQPHMIREIRHFTGRTPGALDSEDAKILRSWLSKDNLRQLDAYPG